MITIWKFALAVTNRQSFSLPADAKVLCVQTQQGQGVMWVLLNISQAMITRTFRTVGTGNVYEGNVDNYIGTYQLGSFVWHVFEEK
jgi:hypothetical protein